MNIKIIRNISIISLGLILIGIIIFIMNFHNQYLSDKVSDWGNFGSYISGIINPILAGLNIYIFYILTKTASDFGKQNVQKQLSFSTCQEYQNKINDLTFQFLANIELCQKTKKEEDKKIAINRLIWLCFFINSFVTEAEPLIPNNLSEIIIQKNNFEKAIKELIETECTDVKATERFFVMKSEFIKSIFEYMIK